MVRQHVNRAKQKYANAKQKAHEYAHPRMHEYWGAGAAIGAVLLLILGGSMGSVSGGWDVVWFYVAVVMAAAIFPIKEHDELGHAYAGMYMFVLFAAAVATSIWHCVSGGGLGFQCIWNGFWSPASLTLLFGATLAYAIDIYEWSHSEFGKVNAIFMVIFISIAFLHGVPWEEINNGQGTIPETGMALRAATQPLADAGRNGAQLVGDCLTVNFDQCRESAARMYANIATFVQSLPFGDHLLAAMEFFTDKTMGYIDGMSCIGSQGGLFGIAYSNPALTGDYEPGGGGEVPHEDLRGCFTDDTLTDPSGPGGDGTSTGDGGMRWTQLEVRSGTAILTFDKMVRGASVSATGDVSLSSSTHTFMVNSASPNRRTVRLSIDTTREGPGPEEPGTGVEVTASIVGEITAADGSTLSGGSCTDGYADGAGSSC